MFANGNWSMLSPSENSTLAARSGAVFADLHCPHSPFFELVLFGGSINALTVSEETWLYGHTLPLTITPVISTHYIFDPGQLIPLSVHVVGGRSPYVYSWLGLPSGCSGSAASNVTDCTPQVDPTAGDQFSVIVVIHDSLGADASSVASSFIVEPALKIQFVASPPSLSLSASVTFSVTATGGLRPYTYVFSGLPPGCASVDFFRFSCTPSAPGIYRSITANVTDATGVSSYLTTSLVVSEAPTNPLFLTIPFLGIAAIIGVGALVIAIWWIRRGRRFGPRTINSAAEQTGEKRT